jgi:hypothetical protein
MQSSSLFLSSDRAAALETWRSPETDVVSLHLAVDAAGSYPTALGRLLREAREADPRVKALPKDVERIAAYVRGQFSPAGRHGLCVISCVKRGMFEAFALPETFKTSLTVSDRASLRPLAALTPRYRRFLALLADDKRARFVEIYLGESAEVETLDGDVLGAGLPALAARAAALAAARRTERFVLGASEARLAALAAALPAALQDSLILEPLLGPERPIEAVTERVRHNEKEALRVRESVLVRRFLDEKAAGGAVAGLEAVAAALHQGCVKRILVREGWAKMGRCCSSCRRLSLDHRSCPWCFRATRPVLDVVAELVDRALDAGIEVAPVSSEPDFDAIGRIGAELAAPAAQPRTVPESRALRARFALKDGRSSPLRPRRPA